MNTFSVFDMAKSCIIFRVQVFCCCFFKFFGGHTCPFFGGSLVPLFWISGDVSSGVQSQSGLLPYSLFAEANVMYIPQDPPLVLHLPTSW